MNKVLVIAVREDQLRRRMWEDAIVSALNSEGHGRTGAVASYQLFTNEVPGHNGSAPRNDATILTRFLPIRPGH